MLLADLERYDRSRDRLAVEGAGRVEQCFDQADDGLWHVKFKTDRLDYDLYLNFVKDKDDLKERFKLFRPVYLDYYDSSFRNEGSEFRYTFFGIKE